MTTLSHTDFDALLKQKLASASVTPPKDSLMDTVLDTVQNTSDNPDNQLDDAMFNAFATYEREPFANVWDTLSTQMWLDNDLDQGVAAALGSYAVQPADHIYSKIEDELDSQFDFILQQKLADVQREPSAYIWREVQPKIPLSLIIKRIAQYACFIGLLAFVIWLITPYAVEFVHNIEIENTAAEPVGPVAFEFEQNKSESQIDVVENQGGTSTSGEPNTPKSSTQSQAVLQAGNQKTSSTSANQASGQTPADQVELNIAALHYEKQSFRQLVDKPAQQIENRPKRTLALGDIHSITGRKLIHSFYVPLEHRGDKVEITLDMNSIDVAIVRNVTLEPIELIENKVYFRDGVQINIEELSIETDLIIQFLDDIPMEDRKALPISVEEMKRQIRALEVEKYGPE